MFKIRTTSSLVRWPVTIVTLDESGQQVKHDVTIHYSVPPNRADIDVRTCVVGWDGVVDTEGRPVEFSKEALDNLIADVWAYRHIDEGFVQVIRGEHILKN